MRLAALVLLCLLPCAAQKETNQTMLTGSDVPDSAAWRIWLDSKAEAAPHSAQFTSWINRLTGEAFSPQDLPVFQTILEQYYEADSAAHLAYLAEADSYAQAGDAASVERLQEAYINRKAILVANTIDKLNSQLSGGFADLEKANLSFAE
jgi:anaerobic selenocysteine-containing dehydrogenase